MRTRTGGRRPLTSGLLAVAVWGLSGCQTVPNLGGDWTPRLTVTPGGRGIVDFALRGRLSGPVPAGEEALGQRVLNENDHGERTSWENASIGTVTMWPVASQLAPAGSAYPFQCRRFEVAFVSTNRGGVARTQRGEMACRDRRGLWRGQPKPQ